MKIRFGRKMANYFFFKTCVLAIHEVNFFPCTNEGCVIQSSLCWFESESKKKLKSYVWNLDFGQKLKNRFKRKRAHPIKGKKFLAAPKRCTKESPLVVPSQILKSVSLKHKKIKIKHCQILTHFAVCAVVWLTHNLPSLKPDLGHFQRVIKIFYFEF